MGGRKTIYCKIIERSSLKQKFTISQTLKFYRFNQKPVFDWCQRIRINYVEINESFLIPKTLIAKKRKKEGKKF